MKALYFSSFVTLAFFALPGCCTSHHIEAHLVEYKTLTTLNESGESRLNTLGKDGWVVVGFSFAPMAETHSNDEYHYVLMRRAKLPSNPPGPPAATASPANTPTPPLSYQWYFNPNNPTNR
jgi:hypothetical protein